MISQVTQPEHVHTLVGGGTDGGFIRAKSCGGTSIQLTESCECDRGATAFVISTDTKNHNVPEL